MGIDYNQRRWTEVKQNYRKWWAGELSRPLIQMAFGGYAASRPKPDLPWYGFTSFYDLAVPAEKIVDWWEYHQESTRWSKDAFPHVLPNFGPGVAAAFMGAGLHNSIEVGTTWFHPKTEVDPRTFRFAHDPTSPWWPRVCDIYRAARSRFGGLVQLSATDLGGNLDLLSSFRPGEQLLLDLYDNPEAIKRLTWEAHDRWWDYYDQIAALCGPEQPGYTCWTTILSEKPYYMLQCDFCYMIGPAMFDEFVKPELAASCRKLTNAFYHLDGPGQLPHLDSLLSIPELKGVQWVPGSGQREITEWPEVYRKIHRAGKLIQFFTSQSTRGLEALDIIADQIGTAKGIIAIGGADRKDEDKVLKFLAKYGAA